MVVSSKVKEVARKVAFFASIISSVAQAIINADDATDERRKPSDRNYKEPSERISEAEVIETNRS